MGWNTKNGHERTISEINITPLTDVMLVLLVIFMVTTPLIMAESFKIKLPKAVTADSEPGKGAVVSVSESGLLSLDGRPVSMDELADALRRDFSGGAEKTVVVRADGAARHKVIVRVLDVAKQAGAVKLSIATEHEDVKKK